MRIITDDRGMVLSFAFIGNLVDGIEVPDPKDMEQFLQRFYAYQLTDGNLVYNADEYNAVQTEEQQRIFRKRRETECFAVVNRGQLWYEGITLQQMLELRQWYKAWLNVTKTMVVPERPAWLE